MKKILATFLAASLLLSSLSACSSKSDKPQEQQPQQESQQPAQEKDRLARILDKGEIVIATEGTWAPWTYHDESSNQLVGFDIEVAQAVADELGVKATFVEGAWDGLLTGLEGGRYDIMANGVDVTPDRAEKYDFSAPYAYNRTAVVVRSDDDSIQSLDDLSGKTTANTITSTYAELAQAHGAEVTAVDDLNQTMELLLAGRIDATLNSEVTVYEYMAAQPDAPIKIAVLTEEATRVALPMAKGEDSASLLEAINSALDKLRQEGKLKEISEKYFGSDISAEPSAN